jgi:hypothetical protein
MANFYRRKLAGGTTGARDKIRVIENGITAFNADTKIKSKSPKILISAWEEGLTLTGQPVADWQIARGVVRGSAELDELFKQVRLLRLFQATDALALALTEAWNGTNAYTDAAAAVRRVLASDSHLAPARRTLGDKVRATKILHRNDVLVNSTGVGTLGRVARWTTDVEATVDSHITIVRFDAQQIDPVCAGFAMLRSQPEIEAMGEGSTGQTELRRTQVGSLKFTMPSPARQRELRVKLDSLEERADQALTESRALATLRDSLLPQLMSGRLRVKGAQKIVEDHA